MATALSDVQTRVAYRLGENSATTASNEKARRKEFILQGYRWLINKKPWWFTETSTTMSTVADQQAYGSADGFPTDFREPIELRIDNVVFTYIPESKIFGLYDATKSVFNYDNLVSSKHYYIFNDTLYLYPEPSASGTNNIALKYYEYPTEPSDDADTFDIPDSYANILDAYAYGRISQIDGMRGDAADAFNEVDEMLVEMEVEHNRKRLFGKGIGVIHPAYLVD